MKKRNWVAVDLETHSDVDITKFGLAVYLGSEHTRVLIAAVASDEGTEVIDFTFDPVAATARLKDLIGDNTVVAHNAEFEMSMLAKIGIPLPTDKFIDSAVLARACGFGGSLEAAAPQILGVDKIASGKHLIKLFSIPAAGREEPGFDETLPEKWGPEWAEFQYYCKVDAELSLRIAHELYDRLPAKEQTYYRVTTEMNVDGWPVDLDLVAAMLLKYGLNLKKLEDMFRAERDAADLNLYSFKQLTEWCAERGVRIKSFDEKSLARLVPKLEERLAQQDLDENKRENYEAVLALLLTKQALGGSSLKKLETIINRTCQCGRLHGQYLHFGASATGRTTGVGVQMQNLKRMFGDGDDVSEVMTPDNDWSNHKLARNLRQVFRATHPDGMLIVGDFSSVESRGLAWLSGEEEKLTKYRYGADMYKELAAEYFHKPADQVTKEERSFGKVGDLGCGYGAGPAAVRAAAENFGVEMTQAEAEKLVDVWRTVNSRTVQFWHDLDDAMHRAIVQRRTQYVPVTHGHVVFDPVPAPESLRKQTGDGTLQSLVLKLMLHGDSEPYFVRFLHGTHVAGKGNVLYWKPSQRKTGNLWTDRFTDPKSGEVKMYSLYGGKLAGLLTQSLCREIFFESLTMFDDWARTRTNLRIVDQFHDEIGVEWWPTGRTFEDLGSVEEVLGRCMTTTRLKGFPLHAVINHARRYVK